MHYTVTSSSFSPALELGQHLELNRLSPGAIFPTICDFFPPSILMYTPSLNTPLSSDTNRKSSKHLHSRPAKRSRSP